MANFEDKFRVDSQDFAKKIPVYNHYGKLRNIGFEFDLSAALALGDKVYGVILPKNAKVIDAYLKSDNMGANGIFQLGLKDIETGTEDTDSLIGNADAGGQTVLKRADKDSVAIGSVLLVENQLVLEVTEATANAVGKISGEVIISVE